MLRAAIIKELRLLGRDRGTVISLFLLPLIFIAVFGSMFTSGPGSDQPKPVSLWSAPGDPRGDIVEQALTASGGFRAVRSARAADARAAVKSEDAVAAIILPVSPTATEAPAELVLDLTAPIQVRAPLQGALTAIVSRALAPTNIPTPVYVVVSPLAQGPAVDNSFSGFQLTVPGNAVLFGFFIALSTAMAFAEERRSGVWRRALAAPVSRSNLLLAKLLPFFVIGLIQQLFLFGLSFAVFGLALPGSLVGLVLLCVTLTLCAVTLGLAMATLGGSEKQLGGVGSVVLLVLGLLGGCMIPRIAMPSFMKMLGLGTPHGWALDGFGAVLLGPGGLSELVIPLAGLLGFTVLFGALGIWRFKFER